MNKGKNLVMAVVMSIVVMVVVTAIFEIVGSPAIKRFMQILGGEFLTQIKRGEFPASFIQFFTYVAFFWGIFEINDRLSKIRFENNSFSENFLPEQEDWVIAPDEVMDLMRKMKQQEKTTKYLMTDIIKKACTKFRANRSISDVLGVVNSQVKINMTKAESSQSVIRYLVWAIPSIGFIGTIMGIAKSLGFANEADDPEGLALVTNSMYIAFDTTLVALFMSIILVWFFYRLQEKEDNLHTNIEEYVIENLVNRINLE